MTLVHLATACSMLLCAALACAQTQVYRCGPNGREYSQLPCPGGSTFDAADTRDDAQRAQAKRLADQERAGADRLERERMAREAAAVPSRAVALDARRVPPAAAAASKPLPSKRRKSAKALDDGDFIALGPKPVRKARTP